MRCFIGDALKPRSYISTAQLKTGKDGNVGSIQVCITVSDLPPSSRDGNVELQGWRRTLRSNTHIAPQITPALPPVLPGTSFLLFCTFACNTFYRDTTCDIITPALLSPVLGKTVLPILEEFSELLRMGGGTVH